MNEHINNEKIVLHYVKLTNPLLFQTRFPKLDQPSGGKWLIPGVTVSAFPRAGNAPLVTAHARY